MKSFRGLTLTILGLIAVAGVALAQNVYQPVDPCGMFSKSETTIPVAISTSSPAVTQLVAAPTTGGIWICDMTIQPASSSSVQLQTGTGSACGTGNANLTGAYTAAVSKTDSGTPPLRVPAGKALCANVTGTGGAGHITYVAPGF